MKDTKLGASSSACCVAYLAEGEQLIAEWSAPDSGVYPETIAELRATQDDVRTNGRCPWHDLPEWGARGWRNYLACMAMASEPDFEERLAAAPIVVIPAAGGPGGFG